MMNKSKLFAGLLAGGLVVPAAVFAGGVGADPGVPASSVPFRVDIDAIRDARDPTSASDAYYRAVSDPSNDAVRVKDAFVRRMIDFGVPGEAETAARDLVRSDGRNGVAWAVLAYAEAARGETTEALSDAVAAARLAPGEAFVQRTAAQMLAWYDVRADRAFLSDSLRSETEDMRASMMGRPAFSDAYRLARDNDYAIEGSTYEAATEPSTVVVETTPQVVYETTYVYTDPFVGFYGGPSYAGRWHDARSWYRDHRFVDRGRSQSQTRQDRDLRRDDARRWNGDDRRDWNRGETRRDAAGSDFTRRTDRPTRTTEPRRDRVAPTSPAEPIRTNPAPERRRVNPTPQRTFPAPAPPQVQPTERRTPQPAPQRVRPEPPTVPGPLTPPPAPPERKHHGR